MVLRHNLAAQNAVGTVVANTMQGKKSAEKLASGFRINRAGDDASGLAVSEKMRAQIGGLAQAAKNTQDSISLIQTAEGGRGETHAILQRMRELAVQSSNGTYQDFDREAMQLEVDELKGEVDRIAQSTEFNGIKLLDGSLDAYGGGNVNEYGARFGLRVKNADFNDWLSITSSIEGCEIIFTSAAS